MAHVNAAEHAKNIRADIKAAQKSGSLPAGIRFVVKSAKFAGACGQSVTVSIASADGFVLRTFDSNGRSVRTAEGEAIAATLNAIVDKYHVGNYQQAWSMNFYRDVQV